MSASGDLIAGRYRLVSQIGSGGMGLVWLARDETLHRDVAIKEVVLPPDLTDVERDELHDRTLREARAAGRLSHPNVVAVYDVIQAEGRPWIVMELVRSRSLYQTIREDGPVTPKRAAEIGLAVLSALRAAHKAGVWHRDVKPGNVLLAEDGRVVLTDFGLATYDGDGGVTRSGLILGSAQYIAPERARDGASGPESDMWSLGATLYAAVEGRSPYARESSMATLTALATQPPDTPRRAGPLRPLLIGLLRKNPRHRMRASEAEKLLRRIAAGDALPSRRGGRLAPRQREGNEPLTTVIAGSGPEHSGTTTNVRAAVGQADAGPARRQAGIPPSRWATNTEETYGYPRDRRRWWPWVVAIIAVALALPAAVLGMDSLRGTDNPTAAPTDGPTAPVVNAGMGVQACTTQDPADQSPVPDGGGARAGEYAPLPNWTYYRDASGFHIAVPRTWRMSRIGNLFCFRDPNSPKAIAVLDQGKMSGDPTRLLAESERAWRDAANLPGYVQVGITDAHYDEGAADLEYTYFDEKTLMHGKNRMLRLYDRVFTVFWLTTDFSWSSDQALLNFLQPSFGLEPTSP
jgi:eukaryotic-like serine/threonine-protein kinase